jgi:hypothetical protein
MGQDFIGRHQIRMVVAVREREIRKDFGGRGKGWEHCTGSRRGQGSSSSRVTAGEMTKTVIAAESSRTYGLQARGEQSDCRRGVRSRIADER